VTCGGGTQSGSRTISQQAANGGTECTGGDTTTRSCNAESCPGGNGDGEQPDPECTETYHADGFVCKREKGQAKTDCRNAKKKYNSKACREVRKQLGM